MHDQVRRLSNARNTRSNYARTEELLQEMRKSPGLESANHDLRNRGDLRMHEMQRNASTLTCMYYIVKVAWVPDSNPRVVKEKILIRTI